MFKREFLKIIILLFVVGSIVFTGSVQAQELIWDFNTDPSDTTPDVENLIVIEDVTGNGIPEVVAATLVYGRIVYCLEGQTGDTIWTFPVYPQKVGDLLSIDDINSNGYREVLIADGYRLTIPPTDPTGPKIYCLDSYTRELLWTFTPDPQGFIPALANIDDVTGDGIGDIIASSDSGWVAIVDGVTGTDLWVSRVDALHIQAVSPILDVNGDDFADVLIGNWTDTGGVASGIYCFSGIDGSLLWYHEIGDIQSNCVKSIPDINDDGICDVITGTFLGEVYAFSGTGSETPIWSIVTDPAYLVQEIVVTQDVNDDGKSEVIVGSWNNNVYCFDGANGDEIWSYAVINWVHTVACAGDITGDGVNEVLTGDRGNSSNNNKGSVYCIDGLYGNLLWRYETDDMVWAVAGIDDVNGNGVDDVVAGSDDGLVYCLEGDENVSGVGDNCSNVPAEIGISQNYPNPFNANTTIQYLLPTSTHVDIEIYNVTGQKIKTLIARQEQAGYHQVTWDASDVSSGIYFYRISTDSFVHTNSMLLLK